MLLCLASPVRADQPFIAPAQIDNSLEVTGPPIAAREINSRMLVGVTIDGKGPFRFFVDSGADRSVVGAGLAARLNLPAGPQVLLHSTASPRVEPTARIASFKVGGSDIPDVVAPILPEQFLGAEGVIGIDALADQRMTIDYSARTVTIADFRKPQPEPAADEIIVIARRRKGQLILTEAAVGNVGVSAVIDTGTEITIGNPALLAKLSRRRNAEVKTIDLLSVTGETVSAQLIVAPEVHIGGAILQNVPIAFSDIPPFKLFGLDQQPAVLLGTDVLQAFRRVSMDFRRKRIRFTRKR